MKSRGPWLLSVAMRAGRAAQASGISEPAWSLKEVLPPLLSLIPWPVGRPLDLLCACPAHAASPMRLAHRVRQSIPTPSHPAHASMLSPAAPESSLKAHAGASNGICRCRRRVLPWCCPLRRPEPTQHARPRCSCAVQRFACAVNSFGAPASSKRAVQAEAVPSVPHVPRLALLPPPGRPDSKLGRSLRTLEVRQLPQLAARLLPSVALLPLRRPLCTYAESLKAC